MSKQRNEERTCAPRPTAAGAFDATHRRTCVTAPEVLHAARSGAAHGHSSAWIKSSRRVAITAAVHPVAEGNTNASAAAG